MNPKLVSGFGNLYLTEAGKAFEKHLDQDDQEYFQELPIQSTSKYDRISVLVDGKRKRFNLHVLMAVAFLGLDLRFHGPHNFSLQVNDIDNNKRNNNLNNLEIVTKQENLTRTWIENDQTHKGFASKGKAKNHLGSFQPKMWFRLKL